MAENAGGIDRKADEKMEFSTSKEVTVHPTFEAMSLKGRLKCSRNASFVHC
jgi:ATP-dependent RNA helicase